MVASSRVLLCSPSVPIEEVKRVQLVGNQPVQVHSDKVWMLVFRTCGSARPEMTQRRNKRLIILALAQLDLALPSPRGHAEPAHRRTVPARNRKADGQPNTGGPQFLRAQPHRSLVQQLVRHRPSLLRRTHLRRQHMLMAHRLRMLGLIKIEVFPLQPVPQPLAQHRSPNLAGMLAIQR